MDTILCISLDIEASEAIGNRDLQGWCARFGCPCCQGIVVFHTKTCAVGAALNATGLFWGDLCDLIRVSGLAMSVEEEKNGRFGEGRQWIYWEHIQRAA
jgi:hypothetical protein